MYKLSAGLPTVLYFVFFIAKISYGDKCISTENCECVLSNNSVINLRSITNEDGTPRYDVLLLEDRNDTITHFYYNPCYKFKFDERYAPAINGSEKCTSDFACQMVVTNTGHAYQEAIISTNATDFTSTDITYIDDQRKLKVSLVCNKSLIEPVVKAMRKGNEYNLILSTKCACADGCKSSSLPTSTTVTSSPEVPTTPSPSKSESKLSTGSILLIIFFTLVIAYIVGGIFWNGCYQGASGIEMFPNIEFWKEFPALVVDGARFSVQCCKNRTTYADI